VQPARAERDQQRDEQREEGDDVNFVGQRQVVVAAEGRGHAVGVDDGGQNHAADEPDAGGEKSVLGTVHQKRHEAHQKDNVDCGMQFRNSPPASRRMEDREGRRGIAGAAGFARHAEVGLESMHAG